jgi:mRNA-degrading endonuclease RelE of RelBE toxin-antitoxin system
VSYDIAFSQMALEGLKTLRKFDQQRIRDAIVDQLTSQPTVETRNRKRLRENPLARWEIRVGKYRVFYDVAEEENLVRIIAIGYKEGSKLFILDEEYEL